MARNNYEPALPVSDSCGVDRGITKLEYFTAAALTGLLAATNPQRGFDYTEIAEQAIESAQTTLALLEK